MRVGIAVDDMFLAHDNGLGHPERADRIRAINQATAAVNGDFMRLPVRPAQRNELERVHSGHYLDALEKTRDKELTVFDADTRAGRLSYDVALHAAGASVEAVAAAVAGNAPRSIVCCRPPGHHAEADRAMGFCLINNVAVAAASARDDHKIERVAVVDWDVHHGNGTEHIFGERSDVLYISLHQYPHYPGTGRLDETGTGEGVGATVNLPLPAGFGDSEYIAVMERIVVPILDEYSPGLILVSAGFDAHRLDPLSGMNLSAKAYSAFTALLMSSAVRHAQGRVVHVLEGGYHLQGLEEGVTSVLLGLAEDIPSQPTAVPPSGDAQSYISGLAHAVGRVWQNVE